MNAFVAGADETTLAPLATIGLTAVVAMVAIAVRRSHKLTLGITLSGLGLAVALLGPAAHLAPRSFTLLLRVDGFALLFIGLIAASAFVVALLAYGYLQHSDERPEEFYVLLLVATLGAAVLAASSHFASLFLGLEILSVSLYGLCAYPHTRPLPLEAGIKYLVLAASSAAFLLFGMALIYAATGALDFQTLAGALPGAPSSFVLPGLALILVGIGFKLSLVPFHLWAPDVYQGAPAPVTAFIATASKAGIFAVLVRLFYLLGGPHTARALTIVSVLAIASMVGGNLLALRQRNLKRILAYSSIAHMGYVLVAFEAASASRAMATAAVGFYFIAYCITTLGAFGIIAALTTAAGEPDLIEDYRGLFWRRPALAVVFTAMLLSLAGIPLTAGFIAKFYVVASGAAATLWLLLVVLVATSVVGLYYYLRVVVALFAPAPAPLPSEGPLTLPLPRAGAWVLAALLVALLWIGIYPQAFLHLVLSLPLR
ncbi:MAG TPA: NADH-quinone oxidoreductase subunit N [Terriglobales bacterium]|nr:NADH-quinone oxidoreductase subunit N [Terriglobales bacterium]